MFRRLSSPLDVTIRALRSTDSAVPRVQQLDNRCFQGGERSDIVAEIDRPFTYLWIAALSADPQCVVGYILTWHVADELHILNVATDPDHRGLGVGHALVAHIVHVEGVLVVG
ncbi:MAG TPA: N-acetyltransferase, partial [Polyangiaceae bacterium]|nr:N-acetyltransferase [Polyangiaceae bacterium]